MMNSRTAIGVAVAAALSWSYGAMANSGEHGGMHDRSSMHERMHHRMGAHERMSLRDRAAARGSFEVATPYSPSEAGLDPLPQDERLARNGFDDTYAGSAPEHEVITPLASNEAGMNEVPSIQRRTRFDVASSRSMANPETPWSSNEAGLDRNVEDMRAHQQQVAEVEHARIAAAEWNARIAADAAQFGTDNTAQYGNDTAPSGGTAGLGLHGSTGGSSMNESPSWGAPAEGLRSDVTPPTEVDRTSALRNETEGASSVRREETEGASSVRREAEYVMPANENTTVAVLEVPVEPTDRTVWSVEPLTPDADLTRGATVYPAPQPQANVATPLQDNETGSPSM